MKEELPDEVYLEQLRALVTAARLDRQSHPRWTPSWYAADGRYLTLLGILESYDD